MIVAVGCARESAEDFLLKNAVRKYNRALVETYRMAEPGLLADVAAEQEVRKVDVLITTLQMQNKVLRASLDRIAFIGMDRPGDERAEVKTSEDWFYEHMDRKTRQRVGQAKRIHYELVYTLERKGGKWIVAGIRHDRERPNSSALVRVLARPGFFGTRAPVLPDVTMVGLLGLVSSSAVALWLRGRRSDSRWRWAMVGAYACLLMAGAAWTAQSLLVGNPEAREALSPLFTNVAGLLVALLPAVLALAVASGGVILYRAFHDPDDPARIAPFPLGFLGLASWVLVLVAGIAQYWMFFVA